MCGDDQLLLSLPGMRPMTAPTIRAFLGDGAMFASAKGRRTVCGHEPSTWWSGTVVQPSRAITKEGAAGAAAGVLPGRRRPPPRRPQPAAYYRHLILDRGHCPIQANVTVPACSSSGPGPC
jgi:transposase